jgi:hypothetical protein
MRIAGLLVVSVLTIATAAAAQAQTKSKVPAAPSPAHAYDKLSLGNQKVASALYQAQSSAATTVAGSGSSRAPRPLSLEEISTRRRSGQTWGQIFRDMKAQGLVHERTLGQVVANYLKTADEPPRMLASDRSTGRTSPVEVESDGYTETSRSVGKGGK